MVSSTSDVISNPINREDIVPSRKRIKLPAWLEVAKPRLIPLLLATTVGGMALSEDWPLPSPRLACTLGGGALAAAAAGALNCLWEQDLDKRMKRPVIEHYLLVAFLSHLFLLEQLLVLLLLQPF